MSSDTIWTRIREKPFKPFRLNTSDGKSFEVYHPEMVLLTKNRVTIALHDRGIDLDSELPSRVVVISPLHVASIEDAPEPRRRRAS